MKLIRTILTLSTLAAALLAVGQPLNYAQKTVEVKAGVVIVPSQLYASGIPANPAPHIWYNLDQDNTVKPAKWTFVNPIGPTQLTQGEHDRWFAMDASTPAVGSRVTKAAGPYWEVDLDTISDDALFRYDVLSLSVYRGFSLNPYEREKLRKFMDQGGVLWIDLIDDSQASIAIDPLNPAPFPFEVATSAGAVDANLDHPLMRFPNAITLNDLGLTEFAGSVSPLVTGPVTTSLGNLASFNRWIVQDSTELLPVAGTGNGANTVSIGRVGQGFMVLTSRGVTATLNRGYDLSNLSVWSINRGYQGLAVPGDAAFIASARLAINIISMGGLSTTKDAGSRHTGSNSVDLTAPLLNRFSAFDPGTFEVGQQPALYKGRVIVSKGNQVYVYDARPDRDLDGDGNPDDGYQNPVIGTQADLVWVSPPLGTKLSAPTVVEVPNTTLTDPNRPSFRPTDQVWVTDETSHVYIFDLDTDGIPAGNAIFAQWPPIHTIDPPSGTVANSGGLGPFPVTIHESAAIVTDSAVSPNLGTASGRVWLIDVDSATIATTVSNGGYWALGGSARLNEPSAPATVAYIPIQDGSGGVDRVVYVATAPTGGLTPRPAAVTSIWLGARSESPIRVEYDRGTTPSLTVTTRASYNGIPILLDHSGTPPLLSLGLKLTPMHANGDPLSQAELNTVLGTASSPAQGPPGVLRITNVQEPGTLDLDGKKTPNDPTDDVAWRVDYTVEWGKAGFVFGQPSPENYIRGNLELPDDTRFTRQIVGSPAVAPNGTLFVVTSFVGSSDPGGTLFGFKEDRGPGNFSMTSRFEVYDALGFNLNSSNQSADQISVPPVLTDEDTLVQMPGLSGFLNFPISKWQFTSGPVVRGDSVFVMASGVKSTGFAQIPTGVLLSFKANMPPPSFEINGQDQNFTIVQPDPALSTDKTQPEQYSVLQPGQFTVEPIPGTSRSRIVLNSLMNVTRGRVRDSINTSLPLIIRRGGQTDTLVEPEAIADVGRTFAGNARGRWNPLNWYMVFNGYQPGAGPIVAGQTLYQGGGSVLPGLIANGGISFTGMMFALDANVSPNDNFLRPNSVRPWTQQLNTFLSTTLNWNNIQPSDTMRWPQFNGIQDMDDLRIRVLQAAIPEDGVRNVAGGDDTLAITGPSGLYAFSRSDFMIADSGRICRVDPSGNPIWVTDQTFQAGRNAPNTGLGVSRQLSEPNRVYSDGAAGYWVVDTGNNRVVRLDGASREIRTIEKLKLDPLYTPGGLAQGAAAGMEAGESLKLSRPKDLFEYETLVDSSVAGANPFSNPQPLERWVHLLIADSGNNRIIELVDRYAVDPASLRTIGVVKYEDPPGSGKFTDAYGVLSWHTPEELSGKDYSYNSISRTVHDVGGTRHDIIAFGFGNVEPGPSTLGLDGTNQNQDATNGFGGIVLYDGPNSTVIREFQRPAIAANTFLAENPPGSGNYSFSYPSADQPARTQKLVGLSSVSVRYVDWNGNLVLGVMVTDATGVYELVQDTTQTGNPWVVRWMLPIEAYTGMRHPRGTGPFNVVAMRLNPRGFRPMFAERLDSGEVLVVNGYTGKRIDGSEFQGEVVMVDGSMATGSTQAEDPGYSLTRLNLGFNRLSVKFEVPPVQGARGIIAPVFANRQ